MAETMTVETSLHPQEGIVDLTVRVTMYAPKGAAYHAEGEETQVAAALVPTFEAKGFTQTKPTDKAKK